MWTNQINPRRSSMSHWTMVRSSPPIRPSSSTRWLPKLGSRWCSPITMRKKSKSGFTPCWRKCTPRKIRKSEKGTKTRLKRSSRRSMTGPSTGMCSISPTTLRTPSRRSMPWSRHSPTRRVFRKSASPSRLSPLGIMRRTPRISYITSRSLEGSSLKSTVLALKCWSSVCSPFSTPIRLSTSKIWSPNRMITYTT